MNPLEMTCVLLLAPLAATCAAVIPRRNAPKRVLAARFLLGAVLLGALEFVWIAVEPVRLALLLLPILIILARRIPEGATRRTLTILGVLEGLPLLGVAAFAYGLLPHAPQTVVSPDGRYEVRYQPASDGMPGGALYLAPRGFVTPDLRAYPYRTLVDFATVTTPARIRWTGPREVTLGLARNSDGGPIVNERLGVRVVIEE